MVFKKLPWKLSNTSSVAALYKAITEKNSVEFPKEVKASPEMKDLISLMLEIDEEVRLDWDDIINAELIRKSNIDSDKCASEITELLKK